MGFTKLDEGIVHSSIWSEAYPIRVLWVTMLAMCDSKGFVTSSRSGLIRAANITETEFNAGITILENPDPDSRSPEYDGRRVEKRDGGWQVLNYQKYRNFSYSSAPEAVRQRKHRTKESERDAPLHVTKRRDISASASASASSYNLIKEIEGVWNDFAHKHDIPWINGIVKGSARERTLIARLHDPDWDFNKLLEAIVAQPFLMGDNPRGWLVSFDWILKPANFQKVMEGVYAKKIRGDTVGENK